MGLENFIEAGKRNFAIANEKKRIASAPKKAARAKKIEQKKRQALIRRFIRATNKYLKHQEDLRLANQHGVSIGDYSRCKKNNGVACEPCKAIAAAYVRQKSKEPKYKAKEREWLRNNPHKRYGKRRGKGAKTRRYTRQQIFDRDGYNCYLCNEPVDLTAAHNMGQPGWEMYPHVEHVIPLALGGADTLDNVKIAHAKCNMAKGTQILATA